MRSVKDLTCCNKLLFFLDWLVSAPRLTIRSISEAKYGLRGGFSVVDFGLTLCLVMYWLGKRVGFVSCSWA